MEEAIKLWETHPEAVILEEVIYGNGKHIVQVRDRYWKIIQIFQL